MPTVFVAPKMLQLDVSPRVRPACATLTVEEWHALQCELLDLRVKVAALEEQFEVASHAYDAFFFEWEKWVKQGRQYEIVVAEVGWLSDKVAKLEGQASSLHTEVVQRLEALEDAISASTRTWPP